MAKQGQQAVRRSALAVLFGAWARGKLLGAEQPPRIGWQDAVIVAGLVAAWALGRGAQK